MTGKRTGATGGEDRVAGQVDAVTAGVGDSDDLQGFTGPFRDGGCGGPDHFRESLAHGAVPGYENVYDLDGRRFEEGPVQGPQGGSLDG